MVVSRSAEKNSAKKMQKTHLKFDEKGGILLRIFDLTTLHTQLVIIFGRRREKRESVFVRVKNISFALLSSLLDDEDGVVLFFVVVVDDDDDDKNDDVVEKRFKKCVYHSSSSKAKRKTSSSSSSSGDILLFF